MTERDSDDLYVGGYGGNDQLDPSESLTGDNTEDPLDAGYQVPDREPKAGRNEETADEVREGETLDQRLAEEVPDVSEADLDEAAQDRRAGRLVATDEDELGGLTDVEKDEIASDVGRAGSASSSEEAAMHVVDEDENP